MILEALIKVGDSGTGTRKDGDVVAWKGNGEYLTPDEFSLWIKGQYEPGCPDVGRHLEAIQRMDKPAQAQLWDKVKTYGYDFNWGFRDRRLFGVAIVEVDEAILEDDLAWVDYRKWLSDETVSVWTNPLIALVPARHATPWVLTTSNKRGK